MSIWQWCLRFNTNKESTNNENEKDTINEQQIATIWKISQFVTVRAAFKYRLFSMGKWRR